MKRTFEIEWPDEYNTWLTASGLQTMLANVFFENAIKPKVYELVQIWPVSDTPLSWTSDNIRQYKTQLKE